MAEIGTATVKITPVIDDDALAQVDAAVREAVADALRKVADSLVAQPNEAGTDEPRFTLYAEPHGKGWAIRDATNPDIEARYHSDWATISDAQEALVEMTDGTDPLGWEWSRRSEDW